jgi:hypothetical protein
MSCFVSNVFFLPFQFQTGEPFTSQAQAMAAGLVQKIKKRKEKRKIQ